MKNKDVAKSWSQGIPAGSDNFHTNGNELFSYRLKIGYTNDSGEKIAILYCAPKNFVSQTTSKHVGLACQFADATIEGQNL